MERSEAAFEAFDGVRLTLADGRVVGVPAFTTREAVRYLRLLSRVEQDDADAHHAFVREFTARIQILDVPLSAFGFSFEVEGVGEVEGGEMTVAQALRWAELLAGAQTLAGWQEQLAFLDGFPDAFGLQGLKPPEVFAAGRAFVDELWALVYGLSESFLSRLGLPRRAQASRTTGRSSGSTLASTT